MEAFEGLCVIVLSFLIGLMNFHIREAKATFV